MRLPSLCLFLCLLAAPAAAGELLVGNKAADTVWRLSLDDGRKLGEFSSGRGPHEIAVAADGALAVVADYGDRDAPGHTLTVLDLRGGAAPRRIELGRHGRPHGLRFLPGGRELLVTTEATSHLLRVDAADGRIAAEIALGEGRGHMVALSADGAEAYVTKIDRGTLSRIDLRSNRKTGEVAAGAGAEGLAVRPGSGEIWVGNREAGTVTVHDPRDLSIRATLDSPGFPIRVGFTADGRYGLVSNARAATLAVFDARRKRLHARVDLTREGAQYRDTLLGRAALPIGAIADPRRPRVYVAVSGGDEIAVVDRRRWRVVARWPTGREPDALALSPPP